MKSAYNVFTIKVLSKKLKRYISNVSKRKSFGSFHSEDIEVLVRLDSGQLSNRLPESHSTILAKTQERLEEQMKHITWNKASSLKRQLFHIDPNTAFINHGAFGGVLSTVLQASHDWRIHCESQPLRFFDRELFSLTAYAMQQMAQRISCYPTELLPLPNVTFGINAVFNSLEANDYLTSGSEVIALSLTYGSSKKILADWCNRNHVNLKLVPLPLPILSEESIINKIAENVTSCTKVILLDAITSNTAIQLPIKQISQACKSIAPNAVVIVDAAHELFSQPIKIYKDFTNATINNSNNNINIYHSKDNNNGSSEDNRLSQINDRFKHVDVWISNAHKWLCAPKGSGVLWINPTSIFNEKGIRSAIISHGFSPDQRDGSIRSVVLKDKRLSAFAWDGCRDYSSLVTWPAVFAAWDKISSHIQRADGSGAGIKNDEDADSWSACRRRIRAILDGAEEILKESWKLSESDFACPYEMRCDNPMRLVPLPRYVNGKPTRKEATDDDAFLLQEMLYHEHRIEVPIKCLEQRLYVRISAHVYNSIDEYEALAAVVSNLARSQP